MHKILIVDDDKAMVGLIRRHLSEVYEVIDTDDPQQALALALNHKPDAIVLDLMMPNFSGFELCQSFRALSCDSDHYYLGRDGGEIQGPLHESWCHGLLREAPQIR